MRFGAVGAAAAALTLALGCGVAHAKCERFAFSVNDYGKDGPSRDAQALLDTRIAKWAADTGTKSYKAGKKTVNCTLYLDFGVFDEYTCEAAANVCWGGTPLPPEPAAAMAAAPADATTKAKAAKRTAKAVAKPEAAAATPAPAEKPKN